MDRKIEHPHEGEEGRHGWLWMLAWCIPMIAIVVLLTLGYFSR
jgi:hypothetical protein